MVYGGEMLDLTELQQVPTHELAEYLIQLLGSQKAKALMLFIQLKLHARDPVFDENGVGLLTK